MAKTESTMLPLGTIAPDFSLKNAADNKILNKKDFTGLPLLVMFICNHCPFVKHLQGTMAALGAVFMRKGIAVIAINSNDTNEYPEDNFEAMKKEIKSAGYNFPYLLDETQEIAKSYKAACTPDFFLFDKNHALVYRGQFDESRPGNKIPVTGDYLVSAADALLKDKPVSPVQKPSLGCNIKWKPGNEPEYY